MPTPPPKRIGALNASVAALAAGAGVWSGLEVLTGGPGEKTGYLFGAAVSTALFVFFSLLTLTHDE